MRSWRLRIGSGNIAPRLQIRSECFQTLNQSTRIDPDARNRPIAALIGGVKAVPGRIMGHAGAFALPGEPSALDKIEALKGVGAAIVNHPSRFGPVLKSMLSGSTPTGAGVATSGGISQRREMHTIARRPVSARLVLPKGVNSQKRTLYITQSAAFDLLRRHGVSIAEKANPGAQKLLAVTVNRSTRSPCVIASPSSDASEAAKFDFAYGASGNPDVSVAALAEHMRLDASSADSLGQAISALVAVFAEKEAFLLETRVVPNNNGDRTTIELAAARFGFDDAAFRSCGRQADAQGLRDAVAEDPAEVGVVEKDGIVYIKLEDGDIGTLVNGAGLAMNTVDALADAGGRAANFLDTGGKATSETVKRSFEVILTDPRVKVCFPFFSYSFLLRLTRYLAPSSADNRIVVPTVHIRKHLRRPDARRYDRRRHRHGVPGSADVGSGRGADSRHEREGGPENHCRERAAAVRLRRFRRGGCEGDRAGEGRTAPIESSCLQSVVKSPGITASQL